MTYVHDARPISRVELCYICTIILSHPAGYSATQGITVQFNYVCISRHAEINKPIHPKKHLRREEETPSANNHPMSHQPSAKLV